MRSSRNPSKGFALRTGSLDDWDMRSSRNEPIASELTNASLDDWDMRSSRNYPWLVALLCLSLDDWDMRSSRNCVLSLGSIHSSLDDWDMRSSVIKKHDLSKEGRECRVATSQSMRLIPIQPHPHLSQQRHFQLRHFSHQAWHFSAYPFHF